MPQPVYRAKHRVDGRLRAASGGCSRTDANGLVLRSRGLVRGHHRQGLRHRATVSPRHVGRTSASAHPRPTTNALQQAAYARPRNGYLAHPIAAGALGDRTRRTYRMDGIGHAGMAKQTERTDRRSGRTERTDRTNGQNEQTERTDRTNRRADRANRLYVRGSTNHPHTYSPFGGRFRLYVRD